MKKLLFLFISLFPFVVFSQTREVFPKDSATWSYSFYSFRTNTTRVCRSVDHYGLFGDTLIYGKTYSKLYTYNEDSAGLTDHNPGFVYNKSFFFGAFRVDSLKVYYVDSALTKEYMLFDFGLHVGDSFYFDLPSYLTFPSYSRYLKVFAIDSQVVNYNQYKRAIRFNSSSYPEWVEGIGNWIGGFWGLPLGPFNYGFKCQTNHGVQLLGVSGNCACKLGSSINDWDEWDIVSTEDLEQENILFEAYPNPTSSAVRVNFDNKLKASQISIYSVLGEKILVSKQGQNPYIDFDLEHIEAGMYFIVLENDSFKKTMKLIKR